MDDIKTGLKSAVGCQKCGSPNVTCYGSYSRKKACVPIFRLKCNDCGACLGWLPPFLLPNKHYTIPEIEPGISAYALGSSGYTRTFWSLETLPCCQETLWRWINTFTGLAKELNTIARKTLAQLKPNFKFEKDKRLLAFAFPLARVKAKNHNLNLLYQLFILREYFASLVEPKDFLVWLVFQKRLAAGKKPVPTQFANDQNRLKRDNAPRPPT